MVTYNEAKHLIKLNEKYIKMNVKIVSNSLINICDKHDKVFKDKQIVKYMCDIIVTFKLIMHNSN